MKLRILILLAAIGIFGSFRQAAEPAVVIEYHRPSVFVLVSTNATPQVLALARRVSTAYELRDPAMVPGNPVCCTWLEVVSARTNGYSIQNWEGSIAISGSNFEQLEAAVDRFIRSARDNGGQKVAPVGVIRDVKLVK